jgi:voltage-gated potassium channel
MDSFQETRRQIRIALIAIGIVVPLGVIGFVVLEHLSLLDAIWLTVITLATIGYGDIYAKTEGGRLFTILLILTGLSAFAFAIQATATFLISPAIRDLRRRRTTQRRIDRLENHYIICGVGEMVDKTISYLFERAETRQAFQREQFYGPFDRFLDRVMGDDDAGHFSHLRGWIRRIILGITRSFQSNAESLLDVVVVITQDVAYAERLRGTGLLALEGEPTSDEILKNAGIERAQAMMVMLSSDTEALLTVLTARNYNPNLYITAAALEEELTQKMIRAGANNVIAPFDVAAQFFNNATLRPAVNDFFDSVLFSQRSNYQTTQLQLWDDSPWIGQRLGKLRLREQFDAGVIGLRLEDGSYMYAPGEDYYLKEHEIIVVVAPIRYIPAMQLACREGTGSIPRTPNWQRLHVPIPPRQSSRSPYSLVEAEKAIQEMSAHFVICGTGRVARNAISKLDPERPFVIVSYDNTYTAELLRRGFRVVHGNPTSEQTLRKARVDHALAIMVAIEDEADRILTVLTCRSLSKRLLITATADADHMIPKLHRAGADRVASPFRIGAQFVLLATTRPAVSDFFQYVLFNYQAGIETTELYMQDDSPWIGSTIADLRLERLFRAGVIGVRLANGQYLYAPSAEHMIGEHEVLIVVTPMVHSDELRLTAHGSTSKRPYTLRRAPVTSR